MRQVGRPIMTGMTARRLGFVAALALFCARAGWAQGENTLGTLGAGVPNQSSVPGQGWAPPTGAAPRLANGKPDFSGVWDDPYVPDMGTTNARNPALQKGAGETPIGLWSLVLGLSPERGPLDAKATKD